MRRTGLLTIESTAARIKKNKKSTQIKFKVRCKKYVYTLVLKDSDRAEKLKQSLPPGMLRNCYGGGWKGLFDEVISCNVGFKKLILVRTGLTISDVPRKNAKGKHVAA